MGSRFAAILIAGAITSGIPAADAGDIDQLAWLAGCWQSDSAEPGSGEQWSSLAGGTLLGFSRKVKNGRTVDFEFMQFRYLEDGTLAFIAQPSGRPPTEFRLLHISATAAMFENPDHDFPQRIVYAREGQSKLRARIEGSLDGELRVVEFPMTRVVCDAALAG